MEIKKHIEVLLIGGTGCISSAIVNECIRMGYNTTIINRGSHLASIPKEVRLIKADKNNFVKIAENLGNKKFDAIIDFLCFTEQEVARSFNFYKPYTAQYFFISSAQVYDYSKVSISTEESLKIDNRWDYSINKWKAEEKLRELAKKSSTAYTIIRPSITYGDTRIPYGITPPYGKHGTIIQRILNDKPLIKWNGGANKCNMMRVEDFAKLFIPLIGNPNALNQEFNICSEKVYSFNDVLEAVSSKLQKKIRTIDLTPEEYAGYIPDRRGEIIAGRATDCQSSSQKIHNIIPYVQEDYTLETGIAKTIEAYYTRNWMDGIDYQFEGECDRIVYDWCKRNNYNPSTYNIGFNDYLGNATIGDKITYYTSLHKGRLDATLVSLLSRIIRKFKRVF